jgi:hypothetical protein
VTEVLPRVEQHAGIDIVRVGRKPDPLAFVPLQHQTWQGRFDDPDRLWRTLYTASDEHGAWVEVLGRFRAHPDTQTALDQVVDEADDPTPIPAGTVSPAWLATCYALFESTGDLPLIEPTAPPAGADLNSNALSRAMILHGLQWQE